MKLAYQTNVKKGHRQLDVSIPVFLQEVFNIKVGDKFNWYVKRRGNELCLMGIYIKYNSMKFIRGKKELLKEVLGEKE
jgi:hypothetical protein